MPARIPTEDLISDLRRVAGELGHSPTTTEYDEHGNHGLTTLTSRFAGGWEMILAEAGLNQLEQKQLPKSIKIKCSNCGLTQSYDGESDRTQCAECHTTIPIWRGQVEQRANNLLLTQLANGPATGTELPKWPQRAERSLIGQLRAPSRSKANKARGRTQSVYYLYGDERAAVRRFIEANYEYVKDCLTDQSNPLKRNWDDELFHILVEQWSWAKATDSHSKSEDVSQQSEQHT